MPRPRNRPRCGTSCNHTLPDVGRAARNCTSPWLRVMSFGAPSTASRSPHRYGSACARYRRASPRSARPIPSHTEMLSAGLIAHGGGMPRPLPLRFSADGTFFSRFILLAHPLLVRPVSDLEPLWPPVQSRESWPRCCALAFPIMFTAEWRSIHRPRNSIRPIRSSMAWASFRGWSP